MLTFLLWGISNAQVWGAGCRDPPLGRASPAPTSDIWVHLMCVHRPFFLIQTDVTTYTPVPDDCKAHAGPSVVSFMNVHEPQVQCCYPTTIRFSLLRSARRGGLAPRCAAVTKSQPGLQQPRDASCCSRTRLGARRPHGAVSVSCAAGSILSARAAKCFIILLAWLRLSPSKLFPLQRAGADSSQAAIALPAGLRFLL